MTLPLRGRAPSLTRKRLPKIQLQYDHALSFAACFGKSECQQVVIMRGWQLEQLLPPSEGTTDTSLHHREKSVLPDPLHVQPQKIPIFGSTAYLDSQHCI
ncbi:hypothetical protein ACQUK4_22740 [Ralstonia pseudosolanacearum]|nr:hypothetical protein A3768_5681 [Ralstonia solanacearum]